MPHVHWSPPAVRAGRRTAIAVSAAALVLAATVVGACGSKSTPAPNSTASATQSAPGGTGVAASPTAGADNTPVDPGSIPLLPDPGAQDAYTIEVPAGWQAENIPAPGGFGRRYTLFDNGTRRVQVTVRCERGATIERLSRSDAGVVGSLKGAYAINGMRDVTLGGLQGQATEYTLSVGGQVQETRVLYLQGNICAWQILLQAFGGGQLARYTPLFDAILATFKPALAGG